MTITHAEVSARTNTTIPPHLEAQAEVPLVAKFWRQGDVYIRREDHTTTGKGQPIDGTGVKVVAGEADRNSHILNGDGTFHAGVYADRVLDFGVLVVPAGGLAVLTHTAEHGSVAFAGGDTGSIWRLWGQRSHEAEIQRAAD